VTRPTAQRVLDTQFPEREVAAVEQVAEGNRRWTAVARFDSTPPVVVRLADESGAFDTEAALARAVRERTDVPVPAPLAWGADGCSYLVSEYRHGTDLHAEFAAMAPADRRRLAGAFGRYLGELHAAFAFDGCGELAVRGERPTDSAAASGSGTASLAAPETDPGEWLGEYGLAAVDRLPAEFDTLRDRLVDCLHDATAATPSRLFPWDLRPGNALVADGELTAVVDWERPLVAPAALGVAKVTYLVADWYVDDPRPLRRAVREGYEEARPLPDIQPVHRVAAVADSAVDSRGAVTNPGYPPVGRVRAVAFHRDALRRALSDSGERAE
jgi:hypothetical protein